MKIKQVCLLGGDGFIGRHLLPGLIAAGYRCQVPTRHPHRHRALHLLSRVVLQPVTQFDEATLAACCADCTLVVNLIGDDPARAGLQPAALPALTQRIVAAARQSGATRLLQVSRLGAATDPTASATARAYGMSDHIALTAAGVATTCFRPAPLFGRGDRLFVPLARLVELMPVIPCPPLRLAPVWVGDVVAAVLRAAADPQTSGQCYELCGPRVFYLRELIAYAATCRERKVWILDMNARTAATLHRWLAWWPEAAAVWESWCHAAGCDHNGLLTLGIHPTDIDVEVPRYLRSGG